MITEDYDMFEDVMENNHDNEDEIRWGEVLKSPDTKMAFCPECGEQWEIGWADEKTLTNGTRVYVFECANCGCKFYALNEKMPWEG